MKLKKKLANKQVLVFLTILGPGIIAASAGNDAGGITTYAMVGAELQYKMLWAIFLMTFSLIIVQEMAARMGAVTGKGLSDLIREQFGVKSTFFAMLTLFTANVAVTTSEFAGIAASLELFNISKYVSVPVMALIIWLLVLKGTYQTVEKVFIAFSMLLLSYIVAGFMAKPDWSEVARHTFMPTVEWNSNFLTLFVGTVGTTIAPWMQFYLQSSIADKGITIKNYSYERIDTILGAIVADVIAFFIILSTASALYPHGITIESAKDAALALKPFVGTYAPIVFGIGLFGASVMAAAILPLSTSYAICEAFGWESGLDNKFEDAPVFFILYTVLIVIGACIVLFSSQLLVHIMLIAQVINGILVPVILIYMLKLTNNRRLMGEYVNSAIYNTIAWITVIFTIALTVLMFVFMFQ
ncbi:Nramp family divalent metal transporter [Mahella australiensis]|uniref:Natural resistance-associated macrophage protein n=1 Tax=Mahella australiensis (strain DSM 15567 / CIP 107919 / 50-1 BON) TaxID=697281 RepID=F4A031_MAHA5|nr:Nramp family divalent metal transporter [Mahella australiensis]AEE95849.1 natural resistance-associated macrophage protein [Mahella australiensis 50-1 BON]